MVPDLPYVREDVPDAGAAPRRGGRCAPRLGRVQTRLGLLVVLLSTALSLALFVPMAKADDLTDRRDALQQQIASSKSDLDDSSSALSNATAALADAQTRLDAAQNRLAQTRADLVRAKAADAAAAAKLKQAQADLAKATAAVVAGQARLDAAKKLAGAMVRDTYQQQTNLLPIAVLTDTTTTGDLATRVQWATTMFDTTQAKIDDLIAAQQQLAAQRAQQAALEAQVADDRAAAAAALSSTQQLEEQALSDETDVASLVGQRQTAEATAASTVAQDQAEYTGLVKERASVEQRIAQRIAAAKAAAARKAAAERAAAQRAAAQLRKARAEARAARTKAAKARARAAERAAERASARNRSSASDSGASSPSGAHHGFIYPVDAPITSPYGMRFHPILHVWKLHDGTDFGAGCGTPIKAAYDGTVEEKYFNAGYGNRLIIDHGKVDGEYVSTAYNHAIRYVVHVGQRVSQGQTIGYVGETGYATGCHLHLMVYLNGTMVNPMSWY